MSVHIRPEGVVIHKKKPHHHIVFLICLVLALAGVVSGWSLTVGRSLEGTVAGIRGEWEQARGTVSELGNKTGQAVKGPIDDVNSALKRNVQGREAIETITDILKKQIEDQKK